MTDHRPSPEREGLASAAAAAPAVPLLSTEPASRRQATGRLDVLDDWRALAMFLIVVYHLLFLVFRQLPHVYGGMGALADSGTALFALLAGFLCQYQSTNFRFLPFLRKKALTILCPYAIATVLLELMQCIRGGNYQLLSFVREVLVSLLTGRGGVHLWFVPMLMIFFLLTPLTLWLMRQRWHHVVIALFFVLSLVIGRAGYLQVLHNTFYFLPFYLLGMAGALDHERWLLWLRRRQLVLANLSVTLFFAACVLPDEAHIQTLCRLVFSLAYIGTLARNAAPATAGIGKSMRELLLRISPTSFGIYLYHNSFIGVIVAPIFRRYVTVLSEPLILVSLLVAAVLTTLLMTAGVVAVQLGLKKLGVKNTRWVIA